MDSARGTVTSAAGVPTDSTIAAIAAQNPLLSSNHVVGGTASLSGDSEPSLPPSVNSVRLSERRRRDTVRIILVVVAVAFLVSGVLAAGLISLTLSQSAIRDAATERMEATIRGLKGAISVRQDLMVAESAFIMHLLLGVEEELAKGPAEAVRAMNATLFRVLEGRYISRPNSLYGAAVRTLFPHVARLPSPQNKSMQAGCPIICARPGDPTYNASATFTLTNEYNLAGTAASRYSISDDAGVTCTSYALRATNTSLAVNRGFLLNYPCLSLLGNGSYTEGFWPEVRVTTDEVKLYYFMFMQQFYLPATNATVVIILYEIAQRMLDSVNTAIASDSQDDGIVVVSDQLQRVLAYTDKAAAGDQRLKYCQGASCSLLDGANHSNPRVRAIFLSQGGYIAASTASIVTTLTNVAGDKVFLATQRIVEADQLVMIATYVTTESSLYGSFKRNTIITVSVCIVVVGLISVGLGAVSVTMLRRSMATVAMAYEVSENLAVLDTQSAIDVLRAQGHGDKDLCAVMYAIAGRLSSYKAFLPACVEKLRSPSQSGSVANDCPSLPSELLEDDHPTPAVNVDGQPRIAQAAPEGRECDHAHEERRSIHDHDMRFLKDKMALRKGTVVVFRLDEEDWGNASKLAAFHEAVLVCTEKEGGVIDQLLPTRVVVSFNFHTTVVVHPAAALRAAMNVVESLRNFHKMHVYAILVTGWSYIGTYGSGKRKYRGVDGPSVILAHKLLHLAYLLHLDVLMNEDAARGCEGVTLVDIVQLNLHGLRHQPNNTPIGVYAPTALNHIADAKVVSEAVGLLRGGDVNRAVSTLSSSPECAVPHSQVSRLRSICDRHRERIEASRCYRRHECWWEPLEGENWLVNSAAAPQAENDQAAPDTEQPSTQAVVEVEANAARSLIDSAASMQLTLEEEALFPLYVQPTEKEPTAAEHQVPSANFQPVPMTVCDSQQNEWQVADGEPIGRGSYARVYFAINTLTGATAALKMFDLNRPDVDAAALIAEVHTLSNLRHQNIAAYISCCAHENRFGIFTEYIGGGTLRELLKRLHRVPPRAAASYTIDVLHGLHYLHDKGQLHLDVKLDNVLLSTDGVCKLADFGAVQAKVAANSTTATSMVMGTPRCMAPEALRGTPTEKSDVWSVGVLLFEMLCGKGPFDHIPGNDVHFLNIVTAQPHLLGTVPQGAFPSVSSSQAAVVLRCLEIHPDRRPSVDELIEMLTN